MKYYNVILDGAKIDETTLELWSDYLANFLNRNGVKHHSVFGLDCTYSDCTKQNANGTCLYNHTLEFTKA